MGFFTVSKLGWYAIEPSHLLVWTLIAAALLVARRRRAGIVLTAICAAALLVLLTLPVGNWALRPIENRYSRPPWPERVDGVLILGEGLNGEIFNVRGVAGVGQDGGNLIAAFSLAQRYPTARIIFSGGSGELEADAVTEARIAGQILGQMGLPEERLTLEDKSRNTWENLAFTKALAKPGAGEVWLLVASAFHMPRAMAVAARLDWALIPWPSDYLTAGEGPETHLSLSANLSHLDLAAHEWFGLMVYRVAGKAL